ncbi:MAG: hypothetical protein QM729_05610 [Solirubrobacterales bacterium]
MKALMGMPVLAVALALALAACGGSGSGTEGVAHLESGGTSEAEAGASGEAESGEAGGAEAGGGGVESGGGVGAVGAGDEEKAIEYSECMRENGIGDFPEPVEGRIQLQVRPGSDLNPESPAFQKAEEACRALAPSMEPSAQQEDELQSGALEYAECMRSHGVSNFPDPEVAEGHVKMRVPKGVDPNSPTFQKANEACRELMVGGPGGPEGTP